MACGGDACISKAGDDKTPCVTDRKAIRNEVSLTGYMRTERPSPLW